jgi:penicillin amidase
VRRGGSFEACEQRREVIEVKGRPPLREDVLVTPRGPIIGPALNADAGAVSLRAAWLDARPARGFLRLHTIRSWDDFRRELSVWPLLSQNAVYADMDGRIGWQLTGEAPVRRKGWGTLPLPGWDPDAGWMDERIPFDAMPFVVDPAEGFVATANHQPTAAGDGPYLGVDWLDGYRAGRITEELMARDDWDVAALQRLQLDETTLAWREVRQVVLGLAAEPGPEEPAAAAAEDIRLGLQLLREWDGRLAADSSAATVFELFCGEMWRRIARARAPRSAEFALGRGFTDLLSITTFAAGRSSTLLRRLREQPAGWFERTWPQEMADTLADVVRNLRSRFGADPSDWQWGRLRPLTLEHPLGRVKALAPIFNRGPFPFGGDGNTVLQAGTTPLNDLSNALAVPSLRFVVEAGDWEGARFVLPGGQSGNPLSRHYDDQLPLWLGGEGVPIAWSQAAVQAATRSVLRLKPREAPTAA